MGIIAFDSFQPLSCIGNRRHAAIEPGDTSLKSPIGKLPPYQIAQFIGIIEKALLKDFLVEARAVKSHLQAQLNIALEGLIAWRRHDAIGIIPLIEHQTLENSFPIDFDGFALNGYGTQTGITTQSINRFTLRIEQCYLQIIKMRIIRRPETATLSGNR